MLLAQKVDREKSLVTDGGVRAGVAVYTNEQRRWIIGKRTGRRHRQSCPAPWFGTHGHQCNCSSALAHRLFEILLVNIHSFISRTGLGCTVINK
jgi:hypothetical protein